MELDFDKEVAQAHMNAAGWKMDDSTRCDNPFNCHIFYICDYWHGKSQVISVDKDRFYQSNTHVKLSSQALSIVVLGMIEQEQHAPLNSSDMGAFVEALTGYIKSTQTYRLWTEQASGDARLHAVLNIYPRSTGGGILRPTTIGSEKLVADADDVMAFSRHVREIDGKRHPDWFA